MKTNNTNTNPLRRPSISNLIFLQQIRQIRKLKQDQIEKAKDAYLNSLYNPSFADKIKPYLVVGIIILAIIAYGLFMYGVFGALTTENIYNILFN